MNKSNLIQWLVALLQVIILGVGAFLAKELWEVRVELSSVHTRQTDVIDRQNHMDDKMVRIEDKVDELLGRRRETLSNTSLVAKPIINASVDP